MHSEMLHCSSLQRFFVFVLGMYIQRYRIKNQPTPPPRFQIISKFSLFFYFDFKSCHFLSPVCFFFQFSPQAPHKFTRGLLVSRGCGSKRVAHSKPLRLPPPSVYFVQILFEEFENCNNNKKKAAEKELHLTRFTSFFLSRYFPDNT